MKIFLFSLSVFAFLVFFTFNFPQKHKKADLTYVLSSEIRTLDPGLNTSLNGGRIIRALFEGLVTLDPKTLKPQKALARKWDISGDNKTYIFYLRQSFWSDSTKLTANDFVYSWKRILEPKSTSEYDYMLFYIKNAKKYRNGIIKDFSRVGIKALSDSVLKVILEKPTPYFLDIAAFETLFPVNKNCIEKYGDSWTKPENIITNGAYELNMHTLNHKLRLVKSSKYWNKDNVNLKTIDIIICEGLNTAFNFYETGQADFITDFPNIIADVLIKRKDAIVAPYLGTYIYRFNVDKYPFNDYRVIKAIEMVIDKKKICKHITKSGEIPARGIVPPGINRYNSYTELCYDPDSARKLLRLAGFANGKNFPEMELLYNTSENHKKIAESFAFMVKKELNINIKPVNVEWKVLLEKMSRKDYHILRGSWIGDYTDPSTFLNLFVTDGGNNKTNWSNTKYDSLIQISNYIKDNNKRYEIFKKAEFILMNKGPIINIYYYVTKFLVKDNIKGIYPNIRGYFRFSDLKKVYQQ